MKQDVTPDRVSTEDKHQRGRRNKYKLLLAMSITAVLLSCFLPMFLLYLNNLTEMTFISILKPVGISMGVGILVFLLECYLFHKSLPFSGLLASCTMLLLLNAGAIYSKIQSTIPSAAALVVTAAIVVVTLALLWLGLKLLQKKGGLRKVLTIVTVVLFGLLIINTVPKTKQITQKVVAAASATPAPEAAMLPAKRTTALPAKPISDEVLLSDILPNIYYFVLDEYAAFDVIEKYYNYDNTAFMDFLRLNGFNVSLTSTSISTATQICMADVVTLNYLPSENRNLAYARKALKDALLYKELEALDYSLYQMSTGTYVFKGIPSLRDENEFEHGEPETEDGTTVTEIARDQSLLGALQNVLLNEETASESPVETQPVELLSSQEIKDLAHGGYIGNIKNRLSVFDYFENASVYADADRIAIFSYICSPHVPFLFQANGAPVDGHHSDWYNPQYYLGQYQYVTARIQNIIQAIIAENPNCIIIVQSDHGVRWHTDCSQPHRFEIARDDETHILNAVYCCGRTLEIEGLSATNTMRLLLSQFGLTYPPLDDPKDVG